MYGSNGCWHTNHYETKQDAKNAAKRMGLKDCHKMKCNGKVVWMPGNSHQEYKDYMAGNTPFIDESAFL